MDISKPVDNMPQSVRDAWDRYLATLEWCRQFIFSRQFTELPEVQAQASEFLMQAQSAAQSWVMAPRTDYPRFFVNTLTEPLVSTWYLPCPDFRHRMAFLDGSQSYRIWGRRSNSHFLDFQLGPSGAEGPEEQGPVVPYPLGQFHVEADGTFEIIASPDRHEGNWIALDKAHSRVMLLVREAFYDWAAERPSLLRIERLGPTPARPIQWDEAEIVKNIDRAGRFARHVVEKYASAMFDFALASANGQVNSFAAMQLPADAPVSQSASYSFMVYELGPDDAIIIEGEIPKARYWSAQLSDRYSRAIDFTYHQATLNGHQIVPDSDGLFRLVISKKDPGVPNWLDPVDIMPIGLVYFRQFFVESASELPTARRVKVKDIRNHLPPDTRSVSVEERAKLLRDRAWSMLELYGY